VDFRGAHIIYLILFEDKAMKKTYYESLYMVKIEVLGFNNAKN